jgi:alpha,alpha-trehalase
MPKSDRPRHLLAAWPALERRLRRAGRLAIFTDFDGTLTPIRRRAADVRLSPAVRQVLTDLVGRGHVVGVISGRALEDLRARVGVRGLWYVGGHGFLLCAPDQHTAVLVNRRQRGQITRVTRRLRAALRNDPGITIEHKIAAIAVHYRNASKAVRLVASRAVHRVVAGEPGLRLMPGKKVWEVLPTTHVDKATAVRFILRCEYRQAPGQRRVAIYVGDDVADERVFAHWRGISVLVGRRSNTAAKYYVPSPAEVREFLVRLRGVGTAR